MNMRNLQAVTASSKHVVADSHFYFRGCFSLSDAGRVKVKILATSWFEAWLDGAWLTEGPARFDLAYPEYETFELEPGPGEHILSMHVHYEGVATRLLEQDVPLFVYASVEVEGEPLEIQWNYLPLEAYRKTDRRINCVLGWVEWCNTEKLPVQWMTSGFDCSSWFKAVPLVLPVTEFKALEIGNIQHIRKEPKVVGEGNLVNMSMFTHDPTAGFISRHLDDNEFPAQGRWMRFDLGKVRLGRPEISITAPAGTVVQVAYCEFLNNGRVSPYISSAGGDVNTCNLDHFVLRGGEQTLKPLHPKGGRFMEVHIIGDPGTIKDVEVSFEERVYFGEQFEGSFSCSDDLLNRIWAVGVETLRSCSEDAITDNPTRERGQWLGDAVGAGMDILAVSYADMHPLKRGLLQAAQCMGDDGMIPAIFPGIRAFLPSFSIQWVFAIPHYFEVSGDFHTLEKLYSSAVANIRYFDGDLSEDGLCMNPIRWNFIDWGYRGSSTGFRDEDEHYAEMDPALSLFYLKALQALVRWSALLGKEDDTVQWEHEEAEFRIKMQTFFHQVDGKASGWEKIGYHSAALALGSGLLENPESRAACVEYIKRHMLSCFPNSSLAPQLHDPTVEDSQLITPFFAHHVFPVLIEAGEMDFVLKQFRICWGWSLKEGLTTWPEVFDKRWSHCHQWSGCPTWILSRYVLGLHPRFDLGKNHYVLKPDPGNLDSAEGVIPVPYCSDTISVSWKRTAEGISYQLKTSEPIWLHLSFGNEPVQVFSEYKILLGTKTCVEDYLVGK
ncbi:MAG: hypothetical protein DRP64_07005 [Verrucomicrobia bacterium]|nr:MAG: hypothetical protein DRP64_07005 [Verrucomicrobiota bacterium]